MPPEGGNRFRDNDMRENKNLKRVARVRLDATRFSRVWRAQSYASTSRSLLSNTPSTRVSSWPRLRMRPPAAITA